MNHIHGVGPKKPTTKSDEPSDISRDVLETSELVNGLAGNVKKSWTGKALSMRHHSVSKNPNFKTVKQVGLIARRTVG